MIKSGLKLNRPLVFIKIQTTELDTNTARIVELSAMKLFPDGTIQRGTRRFNPCVNIPESSTNIHGITDSESLGYPLFYDSAVKIRDFLFGCDLAGFNIKRYDLKVLSNEFNRSKVSFSVYGKKIIDLMEIYHEMESRKYSDALKYYCGVDDADTKQLSSEDINNENLSMLLSMSKKYHGVQFKGSLIGQGAYGLYEAFKPDKNFMDISGKIVINNDGRPIFNFGKYIDKPVADILINDKNYYRYLMESQNTPSDTKQIMYEIVNRALQSHNK